MSDSQPASRLRNTRKVMAAAEAPLDRAVEAGLMHVAIQGRTDKTVLLPDGSSVVEFINCSYLGLDTHPAVIEGAQRAVADWGVHFCCARTRFTIAPNQVLEAALSEWLGGHAITFPSVTSAHMAALPLAAAGALLGPGNRPVRVVFDKLAHASMQYLKPILAAEAEVATIPHNDLDALLVEVRQARMEGKTTLYVCDGVYSMGGAAPIGRLAALAEEEDFYLYVDDAHGTSIFGEQGQGYALWQLGGPLPARMVLTFSLAKGFGCNGGGILLPGPAQENLVRRYGMTYAFSGPLDFSIVGAALASLELHRDGSLPERQARLWDRVRQFHGLPGDVTPWSPIAMVPVGSAEAALDAGERLKEAGYFVSTVFFPVVPREQAQLRICVTAGHTPEHLTGLRATLTRLGLEPTP